MMDKHCHVKGCTAYPCFGFGLPSWRQGIRWACGQHREGLNERDATAATSRPAPPQAKGKATPSATADLFGGQ